MKTALAGNDSSRDRSRTNSASRWTGSGSWATRLVRWLGVPACLLLGLVASTGCGTTKSFTATEQLLVSDAVDSTVSQIDFRPLSGRKVFLDNAFVPSQKGVPNPNPQLVHSEYVTSSLRQQMLAAGVFLCEKREEAEVIVEARLGALGFDANSVTYGLPASSSLSTAASTLSGAPLIPLLPELSLAKKEAKQGAAKLALFAYERVSLQPVWQSGIAKSSSSARDTWVLGVGPLQYGTIYEGARFAGNQIRSGPIARINHRDDEPEALVDYKRSQVFTKLEPESSQSETVSNPPAAGGSVTPASGSGAAGSTASATPASATGPATAAPPAAATPVAATPAATGNNSAAVPATSAANSAAKDASSKPGSGATRLHLDDKPSK